MAVEILEVCDAIVAAIQAADTEATAEVERVYLAPSNLATMTGRRVFVYPVKAGSTIIDRDADQWAYTVGIRVIEKNDAENEPSKAWMDARLLFVRECVMGALDVANKVLPLPDDRQAWVTSTEAEVYDAAAMENDHVFLSDCVFEFSEVKES